MFALEELERALSTLGAVLQSRRLQSRILVAGGSSLLLLGVVKRPTADVDVIGLARDNYYVKADHIPASLEAAVRDVGAALGLSERWMNNEPAGLFDFGLPAGYEARVDVRNYGALEVHLVGRFDLVCFKLYAAVDRFGPHESKHLSDLRALAPNQEVLLAAARWTRTQDASEGFLLNLTSVLAQLGLDAEDVTLD
ncbi:DUF6036 family nucleotidyltransferase [Kribbella sp. NPDC026611]|uniref:DUF6036 family nucleotidyltransferase n=1 Tax=Kribbella sp. NPDC026611 TaxID=3154911 RepID=UPI003401A0D8